MPAPTRGPSFARGLWRVAAANVSSGNRVRLIQDGPQAFDAMIDLIAAARTSVSLESYIVRSDEVGQRFAEALVAAAKRGVQVRVLMDWIGGRGTSRRFLGALRDAGVELRVWNPPGIRPFLGFLPRGAIRVGPSSGSGAAPDVEPFLELYVR